MEKGRNDLMEIVKPSKNKTRKKSKRPYRNPKINNIKKNFRYNFGKSGNRNKKTGAMDYHDSRPAFGSFRPFRSLGRLHFGKKILSMVMTLPRKGAPAAGHVCDQHS